MKGAIDHGLPWTPRHVQEANAACYRLAAEASARGDAGIARRFADSVWGASATSAGSFVALLALLLDPRIDAGKILRTVRARAEGREGREEETVEKRWRVRLANGHYKAPSDDMPSGVHIDQAWHSTERHLAVGVADATPGARVVRVTLTRRRILPAPKGGS